MRLKNNLEELIKLREQLKEMQKQYIKEYISVGDFTYGYPTVLTWGEDAKLSIGKFCSIATEVTIMLGGEHRTDWCTTYPFNVLMSSYDYIKGHPKTKGDVIIGNDVWIARGASIMSGITIGNGAVIGANALVTKDVPPYAVVGGNPGKIIKYRFKSEIIKKLLEIEWWNWKDEDIYKAVPILQNEDISKLFEYHKQNILKK